MQFFGAVVDGADFGLGQAAGSKCLSFGGPVEWSAKPNDESVYGAGFKEVKESCWVIPIGDGGVLKAPVGVCQWDDLVFRNCEFYEGVEFGIELPGK